MGPPAADRSPIEHGLGAKRAPDIEGSYSEGQRASSASCWPVSPGQSLRDRGSDTCVGTCVYMCEPSVSVHQAPVWRWGIFTTSWDPRKSRK